MELNIKENEVTFSNKSYNIKSLLNLVKTLPNLYAISIVSNKLKYKPSIAIDGNTKEKERYFLDMNFISAFSIATDEEWGNKYTDLRNLVYKAFDTCCLVDNKLENPRELKDYIILHLRNIPTLLQGRDVKEYVYDPKTAYSIETIYKTK